MFDYTIAYTIYKERVDKEPNTYMEAMKSEISEECQSAMREEMSFLTKN